jgi:hypothetical protein
MIVSGTLNCIAWHSLVRVISIMMWHVDPLLANESANTLPWRWILGNQPVMGNVSVDTGYGWWTVFSVGPSRCYIRGNPDGVVGIPCGGEVEYLHRSPASRKRRRKGKSEIWDSKMWSRSPRDSDPRMTVPASTPSNSKGQACPLVRKSVPHQETRNCLKVINIWPKAPDGCFIPRNTGRLAVGRNIRLRLDSSRRSELSES